MTSVTAAMGSPPRSIESIAEAEAMRPVKAMTYLVREGKDGSQGRADTADENPGAIAKVNRTP